MDNLIAANFATSARAPDFQASDPTIHPYGFSPSAMNDPVVHKSFSTVTLAHLLYRQAVRSLDLKLKINSCILASQAVAGILHALEVRDAKPFRCGLEISYRGRRTSIGYPSVPSLPGMINAHVVVHFGNILFDPTLEQLQSPWHDVGRFAALTMLKPRHRREAILDGGIFKARCYALGETKGGCRVAYFELPPSVERDTCGWSQTPDADPKAWKPIVREAFRILEHKRLALQRAT
ncbi:hypothetical protein [Microvirga sp. P5_D2]